MKVLILNGSPRINGNTTLAVNEMEKIFAEEGIETKHIQIGNKDIRGCIACGKCSELGKCVFDDDIINEDIMGTMEEADGIMDSLDESNIDDANMVLEEEPDMDDLFSFDDDEDIDESDYDEDEF